MELSARTGSAIWSGRRSTFLCNDSDKIDASSAIDSREVGAARLVLDAVRIEPSEENNPPSPARRDLGDPA